MRPRVALAPALIAALALVLPGSAGARDAHRWHLMARSEIPIQYFQGMAAGGGGLFFDGIENGLYRTTPRLRQTAGLRDGQLIPEAVAATQKYNHIGDLTYDARGGGRVLLPLECYDAGADPSNCAGTGAIGVADPHTLAWRYDVTLAGIPKAMWCEVSPDGRLLWTSGGDDLLAYRVSDISRAHAFPAAAVKPVRRLRDAVPPSGITGAAFFRGRLYLAGSQDRTYQVWSVNAGTGARRLEIERTIVGESEGLAVVDALGGALHWMIQPIPDGSTKPTYPKSTILSFWPRLHPRVALRPGQLVRGLRSTIRVRVTGTVLGRRHPLGGATVRAIGARATTDARGRARLALRPHRAGRLVVRARWRGDRGRGRLSVVVPPAGRG
jgi:hypothetical protein